MSFPIFAPLEVYTDLTGKLAVGGTLEFYESGTDTPAHVYADKDMGTDNGVTLDVGTDGRASKDGVRVAVWGDSAIAYRCILKAADGTTIADVPYLAAPSAGATTIPTLDASKFLTNDGTSLLWAAIRQALDPSGASNKVMGSDGSNLVWVDKPSDGSDGAPGTNANITVTDSSFKANNGSGSFWFVQMGSGSAPASGTSNAQGTVTFSTAFAAAPKVIVMPKTAVSGGIFPIPMYYSISATGFTVYLGSNDDNDAAKFTSTADFDWIAFGTVTS